MSTLDAARAWLARHKVQAGASGAGAVALLALWRHRRAQAAAATATATGVPLAGSPYSTGNAYVAGLSGTPDTSLTDYGNYVQDQLNQLSSRIDKASPLAPPEPAPKPSSGFLLQEGLSYVRNNTTGEIFQVQPSGVMIHLTPQQWAAAQTVGAKIGAGYGHAASPAK